MEKVVSVLEFAAHCKISGPVAYHMIRTGQVKAVRCGRQWRITESAVNAFLRGGSGGEGDSQTKGMPLEAA